MADLEEEPRGGLSHVQRRRGEGCAIQHPAVQSVQWCTLLATFVLLGGAHAHDHHHWSSWGAVASPNPTASPTASPNPSPSPTPNPTSSPSPSPSPSPASSPSPTTSITTPGVSSGTPLTSSDAQLTGGAEGDGAGAGQSTVQAVQHTLSTADQAPGSGAGVGAEQPSQPGASGTSNDDGNGGGMAAGQVAGQQSSQQPQTFTSNERHYGIRMGGSGGQPTGTIDIGEPLTGAPIYSDPDKPLDLEIVTWNGPRMFQSREDAEATAVLPTPGVPSSPVLATTPVIPRGLAVRQRPPINQRASLGYVQDFQGLTAQDNIAVNQKLTEPPDLALCTGNGFIIELVNTAYAFYSADTGERIGGPYSLYKLFQVPTNASMTDPGCIFDSQDSKRFFISIQWYQKFQFSYQVIVVSKTSDPREGFNGVFAVDTSATEPALGFQSCAQNGGCLGDYPTYGMDSAAFWFAVNEYTFNGARLAGAILYGVRKLDLLESGSSSRPQAVVFKNFTVQGIKMGFTVQPANCQLGTPYDMRNGGTQYAISSASFYRTNVSSVVTWAIVNTSLIALNFPGDLNPYIAGVSVIQTQGLNSPAHEFGRGLAQTLNGPDLDSKDERLQQVAFGAGYLWTNMQTAVSVVGAGPSSAVAWFRILPYFTPAGEYDPKLSMQGYAAIGGNNVINGAMAANALGDAVLSFSVVGSDYNFSSGYIFIQGVGGAEPVIEITRMGENPLFGFSKPVRNGDYTNAVVGPNNTFIVGAQFATSKVYTTSSGYRQNWGTFIAKVNPYAPAARPVPAA